MRTSARDDIISVFYLVLYLLNDKIFEMDKFTDVTERSMFNYFKHVRDKKNKGLKQLALELCETENQELNGKDWKLICTHLATLGDQIESISFSDKPSYS